MENSPRLPLAESAVAARRSERAETIGWCALFAAVYFIQGIGEPTEGLVSQPVRSLLRNWGHPADTVASYFALLAIPWTIKPLYGLLTDFVPLWGLRRKSYLVVCNLVAIVGLGWLFLFPPQQGQERWMLLMLLLPSVGIAFADVVIDALMVEKGQPRGLTARFQSVQWTAMYAASILTGQLGGLLSQHALQHWGFLICALATCVSLALTLLFVKERPVRQAADEAGPGGAALAGAEAAIARRGRAGAARQALGDLWSAARSPALLLAGGFLFLWNFNPFSTTVQYMHFTEVLRLDETQYGATVSIFSVGAVIGCLLFGLVARRVPFWALLHASIVLGILSTGLYMLVRDFPTAVAVSFLVGIAYMAAVLVQLDLAARLIPPRMAGAMFALLMSLSNAAVGLSIWLGGALYEFGKPRLGAQGSYVAVVAVGMAFTAGCWLLVPWYRALARSNEPDPSAG